VSGNVKRKNGKSRRRDGNSKRRNTSSFARCIPTCQVVSEKPGLHSGLFYETQNLLVASFSAASEEDYATDAHPCH
jgi:hypothetical protein